MTMQVLLNGETCTIERGMTVARLLERRGLEAASVAVAVGERFVPRHAYAETVLNEGEAIDIVVPMQGG